VARDRLRDVGYQRALGLVEPGLVRGIRAAVRGNLDALLAKGGDASGRRHKARS
jgi:hypothetical protein